MAFYRNKRPTVVESLRYYGSDMRKAAVVAWIKLQGGKTHVDPVNNHLRLETHEGLVHVHTGDYVVKKITGELFVINATVFESTYEDVEE